MKNDAIIASCVLLGTLFDMGCTESDGGRFGVPFGSIEDFEASVYEGKALQHLYAGSADHIDANAGLAEETDEWLRFIVEEAKIEEIEWEPFEPYAQGYRTHRFIRGEIYKVHPKPSGAIRITAQNGGSLVFFTFEQNGRYFLCSGKSVGEVISTDHLVGGSLIVDEFDEEYVESEFVWAAADITITAYSRFEPGDSGGTSGYGEKFVEWRLLGDVNVRSVNVNERNRDLEVEVIRENGITIIRPARGGG